MNTMTHTILLQKQKRLMGRSKSRIVQHNYGSVAHSGRLTYEYEANVVLHKRQNALSQFLLDTTLIWSGANHVATLKAHVKQMDQQAFAITRAREDQYVSHVASSSNNRGRLLMAQAYHHLAWCLKQLAAYVQGGASHPISLLQQHSNCGASRSHCNCVSSKRT